jgi:hypothetical protein
MACLLTKLRLSGDWEDRSPFSDARFESRSLVLPFAFAYGLGQVLAPTVQPAG